MGEIAKHSFKLDLDTARPIDEQMEYLQRCREIINEKINKLKKKQKINNPNQLKIE